MRLLVVWWLGEAIGSIGRAYISGCLVHFLDEQHGHQFSPKLIQDMSDVFVDCSMIGGGHRNGQDGV